MTRKETTKGSEALEKVLQGNRRFVRGERTGLCNPVDVDLSHMVLSQNPLAAVLCCSDSRVPPDHILDKKIGEIFVIRVAGKVPGPAVIGSLEYAVSRLKVPLILVLGHENCGAVEAALQGSDGESEGYLVELIKEIEPAVKPVQEQFDNPEDVMREAVQATVRSTIHKLLQRSHVIAQAVENGDVLIKGAMYSLQTGEVTILDEKNQEEA